MDEGDLERGGGGSSRGLGVVRDKGMTEVTGLAGGGATLARPVVWPQGEQPDHWGGHPRGMPLRNGWLGRGWIPG